MFLQNDKTSSHQVTSTEIHNGRLLKNVLYQQSSTEKEQPYCFLYNQQLASNKSIYQIGLQLTLMGVNGTLNQIDQFQNIYY